MSDPTVDPEAHRIGSLNGKWAILFKAQLALGAFFLPSAILWCTWATVQIFGLQSNLDSFQAVGPRYTATQAQVDRLTLRNDILEEVAQKYPSEWYRDHAKSMSQRLESIELELANIRKSQIRP